jgi:hypothetical protein
MGSGVVNVSIFSTSGLTFREAYIWDVASDTVTSIASSTPFNGQLVLEPFSEYFIIFMMCTSGATGDGSGGVTYNWVNYSLAIWGYQPNWECNDWSACLDYQQYRTCSDLNGGMSPQIEFKDCFEPPAYSPAEEYTAGTPVYYTDYLGSLLGYHWYDPKVACQTNEQHCAILSWNSNFWLLGGGLYLFWTDDGFTGSPTYEQAVHFPLNDPDYATYDIPNFAYANATYEPMPYDVMFYAPDNKYYVITTNGNTDAKLWSYTPPSTLSPVWTKVTSGCSGVSTTCTRYYPIGFFQKDTTTPLITILRATGVGNGVGGCGASVWALRNLSIEFYYLNGTLHHVTTPIRTWSTVCDGTGFFKARGTVFSDSRYRLIYNVNTGAGVTDYFNDTIASAFVSDFLGYTYIRDGGADFKFSRQNNGMVAPAGFYETRTSDFSAYTPKLPYYFLNYSIGESIKVTDKIAITGKTVYAYERKTNNYYYFLWGIPPYSTGIYFATKELLPLIVFASYTDPLTGTVVSANITASNAANDNYTETGQGNNILLHTTRRLQNRITYTSLDYLPVSTMTTYDVPSACGNMKFYVNLLPQSYTMPIYVFDESENPIAGATVSVDGVGYTTDDNGMVQLPVSPLNTVTFSSVVDTVNCKITYTPTGNPTKYLVVISKTGYKTSITTDDVYVEAITGGYRYLPEKQYVLTKGANVQVSVQSKGHVPITGGRVTVTASGMDIIRPTAVATVFPFTYTVVNGTYPVNLTLFLQLTGCSWLYNTTQKVLLVQTDVSKSAMFTLPYSIDELPCQTNADCEASFCQGGVFSSLTGCNVGACECQYAQETCLAVELCDNTVGCIDEVSTDECRFDSECYSKNQCLDDYTLQSWTCGGEGMCIAQNSVCTSYCDVEEKVCIGAPVAGAGCDQSTVVGMLGCMQSGVMGFVGSTYNPMIAIGIALFLVILIIAILGLGFRGVASVIR